MRKGRQGVKRFGGVAGEMRTAGALRDSVDLPSVGDMVSVPDERADGDSGRSS